MSLSWLRNTLIKHNMRNVAILRLLFRLWVHMYTYAEVLKKC